MPLGEKDVDALGELVGLGARHDFVPAIERMTLALGLFLGRQLAAAGDGVVLGGILQGVRTDWLLHRRRSRSGRGLARGEAAGEALQPALLLVGELGHGG